MTRPLWDFVATGNQCRLQCTSDGWKAHKNLDIDDENVRNARENVINNELGGRIRVFKTEPKDDLIPLDTKLDVQRYVSTEIVERACI